MTDPRTNPQPGDWLVVGDTLIRVDHLSMGEVYYALFRLDAQQPSAVSATPLAEWLEATAGARIYAMAADDPRQAATILEAR